MSFNRTTFRLKRIKIEPPAPRAGLPNRNISVTKNGTRQPICYAASLGPPDFAWGKI
jgi:hypothetical protein